MFWCGTGGTVCNVSYWHTRTSGFTRTWLACLPQILIWDSGLASALCPRMLACRHSWWLVSANTCVCVRIIQHLLVRWCNLTWPNGAVRSSSPDRSRLKAFRHCSVGWAGLQRGYIKRALTWSKFKPWDLKTPEKWGQLRSTAWSQSLLMRLSSNLRQKHPQISVNNCLLQF